MEDEQAIIGKLFRLQPLGNFESQQEYTKTLNVVTDELQRRLPPKSGLGRSDVREMVFSFQEDHGLPLREIETRLARPGTNFHLTSLKP